MNSNLSNISFDDVLKTLKFAATTLKKTMDTKPIEEILSPLITVCSTVGTDKPYKPIYVPEEYIAKWKKYLKDGTKPEPRSLRYLCWKPDIASDKEFLGYLHREQINLSARSLQGIVRACHEQWDSVLRDSVLKKGSVIEQVRRMVRNYKGPNRILSKWKASLNVVLSSKGPELFAAEMVKDFQTIKDHTELWAVEVQSGFFLNSMLHAVQQCRHDTDRCRYLFGELFPWSLWKNSVFKKLSSEFILDDYFNNGAAKEMLQNFILSANCLGDPRLPRNNRNWLDMGTKARNRFIQWLSKEDIGFFFEHVLPDRKDPHERKSFWFQYIPKLKSSRPLLCSEDEVRLRPLLRDKANVGHFGKIKGYNSAFVLDFGHVKAIEFSRVGACYIYTDNEFNQIIPELWSSRTFTEVGLKDKDRCVERVRHLITYNVDWRSDVMNVLAKYGVRL